MVSQNHKAPTELDTFLPQDGSQLKDGLTAKYIVKVAPRDLENATKGDKIFDPFRERKVTNPTTDCDTLTHLLKASLGTGILAMPLAFKYAGLVNGIFATIFVAFVCTHCSYVLVKCGHVLYYKAQKTQMSFAEIAEYSCSTGPAWSRKFGLPLRYLIQISLFITYFGTCSVYSVIVAKSLNEVLVHWLQYDVCVVKIQYITLGLLVPMILISWVPDLKYLSPVSMIANLFMITGLGITMYYLVTGLNPEKIANRSYAGNITAFPDFFSITIFAMEAIGVVMPLENHMETPQHFVGLCGVLNKGMSGVTLIYIFLGFLGYATYGDEAKGNIVDNLPVEESAAQAAKVLVALTVYCTFGLQFFVCLDIVWTGIKERFPKKPLLANYVLRTVLVICAVSLAAALPTIGPFMGLIGALCFSILGLIIPIFIETVTYWDRGFGRFNWVAIKNIIICIIGISALVFGSKSAIENIIKEVFSSLKNC